MTTGTGGALRESGGGGRRTGSGGHLLFYVFLTVGALALAAGTAYYTYRRASAGLPVFPLLARSGVEGSVRALVVATDPERRGQPGSQVFLVVGWEQRRGGLGLLGLPEESRIRLPEAAGAERLDRIFARGGPVLATRAVSRLLGVPVPYYLALTFDDLSRLVDAAGGVELAGGGSGTRRLSGKQAVAYLRSGASPGDPPGRVTRQLALARALLGRLPAPAAGAGAPGPGRHGWAGRVQTNLPAPVAAALAAAAANVAPSGIPATVLPGILDTLGGPVYWLPDPVGIRQVVQRVLRGEPMLRVEVLNGNGGRGVAAAAARVLEGRGFEVVAVGNADRFDYPETLVRVADERAGRDLLAALDLDRGKSTVRVEPELPAGRDAVVVLGHDYR